MTGLTQRQRWDTGNWRVLCMPVTELTSNFQCSRMQAMAKRHRLPILNSEVGTAKGIEKPDTHGQTSGP